MGGTGGFPTRRRLTICPTTQQQYRGQGLTTAAKAMTALLVAAAARCQDARQLLMEAQRRAHVVSVRYEGVALTSNAAGASSEKHWRFERIGPFGESKILIRFLSPAEVEGVAILILNHREGARAARPTTAPQ